MSKLLRFYSKPEENGKRIPRASVLGQLDGDKLTIVVARCSENDSFNRTKARIITEGRLAKKKIFKTIELPENWSLKNWIAVASEIADEVVANKYPHKKYNTQFK